MSNPIPIFISLNSAKGKRHHMNVHLDSDSERSMTIMEPTSSKKSHVGRVLKASLSHRSFYVPVLDIDPPAYRVLLVDVVHCMNWVPT